MHRQLHVKQIYKVYKGVQAEIFFHPDESKQPTVKGYTIQRYQSHLETRAAAAN